MSKVTAFERKPDKMIIVRIPVAAYGDAGRHWRRVLGGPGRARFGDIYVLRADNTERRKSSTYFLNGIWKGTGLDLDECPGAMFVYTGCVPYDVEEVSSHMNRKLGTDIKTALASDSPGCVRALDFCQVKFEFE